MRMGGDGVRTFAARSCQDVGGGRSAGDAWLRRTFAVGRLTRRSAELRVARGPQWRGPLLLRAVVGGSPRAWARNIH